ncbi:MAG TPA: OmpA family protein [Kofleriaceae bacterium]|nr:OmpA family protein [Kofleriaceae bacterium]
MDRIFRLASIVASITLISAPSIRARAQEPGAGELGTRPLAPSYTDDEPVQDQTTFGDHRFSAGVFLGGDYFSDEIELGNSYFDDQIPDTSLLFGVRAAYVLIPELVSSWGSHPRLSLEAELKLASSHLKGAAAMDRPESQSPVLGWRAHALVDFWPDHALSPFILAGGGGETVFVDSPFVRSPDTDAVFNLGLGARYAFGPKYAARIDLRQGITAGRHDVAALTYEVHVGLSMAFDLQSEPRVKKEVIVVTVPGDEPAPAEPADKDGDGIPDDLDECPNESEIKNLIDDSDGCPEADSDGDGLLGTRDSCPEAAEDKDGFEDDDGCPDGDNDKDGVADAADKCKTKAETQNGFEDDDGCPDEVPEKVKKFTGRIAGIRFRTGSAEIRAASGSVLDKAAAILKEYPDLKIEISGHTDSRGGRELNMRLSKARADSVKLYLVEHGIDPNRISTVGYGPDRPIGDNGTRAGRTLNRRIEFHLVSGAGGTAPAPTGQPASPDKAPATQPAGATN